MWPQIKIPAIIAPTLEAFGTHPTRTNQPEATNKDHHWELIEKTIKLKEIFAQLQKEANIYIDTIQNGLPDGNPDVYMLSRRKEFILQAVTLFNEILSTFMGAFKAHEICQFKKQFNLLSEGYNMLVRVI